MPPAETGLAAAPDDAGIQWQRPSRLLLRARRIQVGLVTVPVALAGGLIAGVAGSAALGLGVGLGLVVAGRPGSGSWPAGSPPGVTPSGATT